MDIARARIAAEAADRTGQLDLRGLGLPELPEELFGLLHLRALLLGRWREGEDTRIGNKMSNKVGRRGATDGAARGALRGG